MLDSFGPLQLYTRNTCWHLPNRSMTVADPKRLFWLLDQNNAVSNKKQHKKGRICTTICIRTPVAGSWLPICIRTCIPRSKTRPRSGQLRWVQFETLILQLHKMSSRWFFEGLRPLGAKVHEVFPRTRRHAKCFVCVSWGLLVGHQAKIQVWGEQNWALLFTWALKDIHGFMFSRPSRGLTFNVLRAVVFSCVPLLLL